MSSDLRSIASRYASLRVAIVGDFCLDRYLEIDPAKTEISIETGLPVYNVTNIRSQPGAAGTILNNLVALGVREIAAVGACGEDGEGWELLRALRAKRGVMLDHFVQSGERKTFTYTKPLIMEPNAPPRELSRLDVKNWAPCPPSVGAAIQDAMRKLAAQADAIILMDQVDIAETGIVTRAVLKTAAEVAREFPKLVIVADSRRGLAGFPPVTYKMNNMELARLLGRNPSEDPREVQRLATDLAKAERHSIFVTMAEKGIVGASTDGASEHVPALPVRGDLDIVGAGDAVTANLTAALAAGANLRQAMTLAMSAASIVIHQLGTTGTASVEEILALVPA